MASPKLHALNETFEWQPATGPYRRITEQQARDYDEKGFFILEDAFDPKTIAEVAAALDPIEAQVEAFLQQQEGKKLFIARSGEITFTTNVVLHSEVARRFCAHEVFKDLGHDLLGPNVRLYWDQAVYKKPGMKLEFPWHQDNGYTFVQPQQYLTCWVALTDATLENGCPWVAPTLHQRGTLDHWMTELGWCCIENPKDAVPLPVRAGSIAVFSSLTPHRTGPNLTDQVRKSYIIQLAPDGAKTLTPSDALCNDPDRQFELVRDGEPVALVERA